MKTACSGLYQQSDMWNKQHKQVMYGGWYQIYFSAIIPLGIAYCKKLKYGNVAGELMDFFKSKTLASFGWITYFLLPKYYIFAKTRVHEFKEIKSPKMR